MFKEKLHKKLVAALETTGISEPTELQAKCLSRINSGADVMAVGPEGSGRSTLITICAIQKLQQPIEEAPRAIVLVSDMEKALAMKAQFDELAKETGLRSVAAYDQGKLEKQNEEIYLGTDI